MLRLRKIIIIVLFIPALAICQADSGYAHKGLIRATATITPGFFLKGAQTAIYISGNLEYYFHRNASFRGDGYYFLDNKQEGAVFQFNHSVLAGVSWHFGTKNHWDPYLAFQPGLGYSSSFEILPGCSTGNCNDPDVLTGSQSLQPLISFAGGANYYFQKAFHIFAELRYTQGKHMSNFPARSVSDIKVSFGLGFNIR